MEGLDIEDLGRDKVSNCLLYCGGTMLVLILSLERGHGSAPVAICRQDAHICWEPGNHVRLIQAIGQRTAS